MQHTAAMRFFELPELVAHLAHHHLDPISISHLMRASRQLYALCTPALFYRVLANYNPKRHNILTSKESINALARNTHLVRHLDLHHLDMIYYIHCVFAYQDQVSTPLPPSPTREVFRGVQRAYEEEEGQEEGRREQGRKMMAGRPRWLAPPNPRICTVFPVPLMTRLTRLDLDLDHRIFSNDCPYFLANFKRDPRAILTHTCWLLDSNPHLRVLRLRNVLMKDHRDTQLLTRSIFGLKQLQDVKFGLVRCEEEEGGWGPKPTWGLALAVFFACPPSLMRFSFNVMEEDLFLLDDVTEEYWELDPGKPQSWEMRDEDGKREDKMMMTAPRWLRKEPLTRLTSLKLRDVGEEHISEDEFRSILAHSPNVSDIVLPYIVPVKDIPRLALDIAHELRPRLTILEKKTHSVSSGECWVLAARILDALPEHQLQVFRYREESSVDHNLLNSRENDSRSIFRRHSRSLRELVLWGCWDIDNKAIQMILVECVALERLDARSAMRCDYDNPDNGNRYPGEFSIDLEDAVEFPWGCTRIQDLRLTISIPDLCINNQPLSPTIMAVAEGMTTAPSQPLESLYRQLGVLIELERLCLQAVFYDPHSHRPLPRTHWVNSFPGMLMDLTSDDRTCSDGGGGWPEYLHLLSGLTKLKYLYGSSRLPREEENERRTGMDETKWMNKHWPMIRIQSSICSRFNKKSL